MKKTRVVVAMSGGVDSSVAAALLVQQGYEVIGIMLRLWAEAGNDANGQINANRCCAPEAVDDARAIAKQLGIPFYDVHAEAIFKQRVVDTWVNGYAEATTPNPCFNCNRGIRFGFLMQRAVALGADYLATGHYANVDRVDERFRLLKGADAKKDQSYVLHVLGQKDLARAMFPCGTYNKVQVRELAREFGLPTAERAESQDLCFLTQGDYRGFLVRNAPEVSTPGPIVNMQGEQIGQHEGLPFYTIGQRKGIQVQAQSSTTEALYVLNLDVKRNAVVVGPLAALGTQLARTRTMHYVADEAPTEPLRCTAKIRYKAREAWGTLIPGLNTTATFEFDEPPRDVAPGQGLVCYVGDEVIGGGVISRS